VAIKDERCTQFTHALTTPACKSSSSSSSSDKLIADGGCCRLHVLFNDVFMSELIARMFTSQCMHSSFYHHFSHSHCRPGQLLRYIRFDLYALSGLIVFYMLLLLLLLLLLSSRKVLIRPIYKSLSFVDTVLRLFLYLFVA